MKFRFSVLYVMIEDEIPNGIIDLFELKENEKWKFSK